MTSPKQNDNKTLKNQSSTFSNKTFWKQNNNKRTLVAIHNINGVSQTTVRTKQIVFPFSKYPQIGGAQVRHA